MILPVEEYIYAENTTKNGKNPPKKIAKTSELAGADVIVFLPTYSRIIHKKIISKKDVKNNTLFFHSVMLFTSNVRSLGLGSENLFITLSVNYRASSSVDSLMP